MNASWYIDETETRRCPDCGDAGFAVDDGCKCPEGPAEPLGSQPGNESLRGDSGSAGPVRVEWAADDFRERLLTSDDLLAEAARHAFEAVAEVKASRSNIADDPKYFAALNAAIKTWGAVLEMQRKTRSDLYRAAQDRESRQEAAINSATASRLEKLRGGRH